MRSGLTVLVVVLVAATVFGLWRRRTDGRIRDVNAPASSPDTEQVRLPIPVADDAPEVGVGDAGPAEHGGDVLSSVDLGTALGAQATLVQFSTSFCQPCRATKVILEDLASTVEGVVHVEIDAEAHLDLVRRLDILRTPTVFVLDSVGRIRKRAAGQPRKADVIAALGDVIPFNAERGE